MNTYLIKGLIVVYFLSTFALGLSAQVFSSEIKVIGPDLTEIQNTFLELNIDDIDNDGNSDLFFGKDLVYSTFFGGGNLEYSELDILGADGFTDFVRLVDINDDSYKDFVTLGAIPQWFENSPTGFQPGPQDLQLPSYNYWNYKFVDVDFDGDLDILTLDGERIVFSPNSGGQFASAILFLDHTISNPNSNYNNFYTADIEADGDVDIFTVNTDGGVTLHYNNDGAFDFAQSLEIAEDFFYLAPILHPYDVDSDGLMDLVLADDLTVNLGWLKQLSDGTFSEIDTINFNVPFADVSLNDFDNDGDIDISAVSLDPLDNRVTWHENDGQGNFISHAIHNGDLTIREADAKDVDNDGDIDIVVIAEMQNGDGQIVVFENLIAEANLSGCVFFDLNENGIKDNDEQDLAGIQISLLPDEIRHQGSNGGCYTFIVEDGTYSVFPEIPSNWELTSDSSSYTKTINGDTYSNLDFGLAPTEQLLAGQMHAVSGITRCNRETKFDFIFRNAGTTVITEGIVWAFPDELGSLASEVDAIDTIGFTGEWGWKFEDLYPGQTIKKSILLNIPGLGGDVEPGTLIEIFSATEAKDTQGFTNFFKNNFESEILCAYDPNDKLVSPDREGEENYTQFKDTMIYTVRFQNTGNDTAFTVVLRDTLDANLDVKTFNILGSSHPDVLRAEILEEQFMTFTFEDILLPDSTIDFIGSQGYVSYSIESKDGLEENTIIENTASIYFDFNPPIVTNTTQNTMVECLPIQAVDVSVIIGEGESYTLPDGSVVNEAGAYTTNVFDEDGCPIETVITVLQVVTSVRDLAWDNVVQIAPNPTSGIFFLDIDSPEFIDHEMEILDVLGKKVFAQSLTSESTKVDIANLPVGTYIVQIKNLSGELMAVKKLAVN